MNLKSVILILKHNIIDFLSKKIPKNGSNFPKIVGKSGFLPQKPPGVDS